MERLENRSFDEERALYEKKDLCLIGCRFDGPADGESALKEASDIRAEHCFFNLRYPLWHDRNIMLEDCEMTELCRAALWYTDNATIRNSRLHGIKALRECSNIHLDGCDIISPEFGWSSRNITMENSHAQSEYFLLRAENIRFDKVEFKGKYSFQYIKNAVFENCILDTKDAFWHSENVIVRNSVVRGEYLAWYSEGLQLINCKIIGTQPLCYCKKLRLVNCEMIDTDLSFERSEVEATITSPVISIKNPRSGHISVPALGELIMDDPNAMGIVDIRKTP